MPSLLAKTDQTAIATTPGTTLLDWTYVGAHSGLSLYLACGDADPDGVQCTVTIEAGDDASTVSETLVDEEVTTLETLQGQTYALTTTYKYVRVRVAADTDDATLAAILTADSATAQIATLAALKARLGLTGADHDAVLTAILAGLKDRFETEADRPLIVTPAAVTEYFTGQGEFLQLRRYPVVSITSIKIAYDYDFDSATALVANTDYRLVNDGKKGVLWRMYSDWPASPPDCIQAIWRGGYAAAGVTPGTGETALPADLQEAAIQQASYWWQQRDKVGLASVGYQGGSVSTYAQAELLRDVRAVLERYRRVSL